MTSAGRRRIELLEDALETRLGEQIQRRASDPEPLAARLHLMLGFLARAVEDRPDVARDVGRRLQQQRRLADARLAAEQHHRSRHDAAAEHAVKFADAGRQPRRRAHLDVGIQLGASAAGHQRAVAVAAGRRGRRLADALFDQRVPRAAVSAASQPLGGLAAALLAHEDILAFTPGLCLSRDHEPGTKDAQDLRLRQCRVSVPWFGVGHQSGASGEPNEAAAEHQRLRNH